MNEAKDAGELIRSHRHAVEFWSTRQDIRQKCHNFIRGNQHSDEELRIYNKKRKAPVVFNMMLAPYRTVVGQFIASKYDMKPAPVEPTDQKLADPLVAMYHWTADSASVRLKDIGIFSECYVGGSAYQESYVEVRPGRHPKICVTNQNPFAIYWDPESRDLINREDANFVDRESFLSYQEMIDRFPEHAALIRDSLKDKENQRGSFDHIDKHADRGHESNSARNGKYRVVERYYRVRKSLKYGVPGDGSQEGRIDIGEDVDADAIEGFRKDYPDHALQSEPIEYLYYAVVCEDVSNSIFLYNDKYHWQPRDPRTDKVMFPIHEVVAESLGSEISGFVEPEIGPQKMVNSVMANILHSSKHSASTSMLVDPAGFESEDQIRDVEKNASDGDRRFRVKKGALAGGAVPLASLPQGNVSKDNSDVLEYASQFMEEVSSAPKALRGVTENSGTPAAQTEMRIQQAFTQLLGLITNWKHFLTKRAKFWQAAWREFFPYEMQVRVIEKKDPKDPDFMTINEAVGVDYEGNIIRANSLDSAAFDITFEESVNSPTTKDNIRNSLVQLMNMSAQLDPVLTAWMFKRIMELTDLPQEDKDFLKQHMQVIQQQNAMDQQAAQQQQQLEAAQGMQNLAQAEAEQTALPPVNQGPNPGAMIGTAQAQSLQPA